LIQGALQRKVIEIIIELTDNYLSKNFKLENRYMLEVESVHSVVDLLNTMERFSKLRVGADNVTKAAPTKLRQQIYAVLRNRGFSDVIDENSVKRHQLIENIREEIKKEMNL